jgi:ABC-type nitrate/sulfonate/bicarbonate transport system permease component
LMTPKMIASVLAIGVLGYTSDVLLRLLTRRVTPWATGVGVGR